MRVDVDGNSWFSSVIAAVAIVAVAAVTVVAVVASAGAVACVAAGVATTLGASAGTAAAVSTVATAGCYAVATGVAACGASDVYEVATGTNPIRDGIFGGDQEAYDTVKGLLSLASAGLTELAGQAMAAGMSCFIAGTPVVTADGQKPIEDIQVSDYVWAWDEETDDVALKQVVETYINETTELTHVFVSGEEIIATPTHPFYCPTKGWTDAAHLRAGDILVLVNGEYVVVEKVQHELLENPVKVYNFQVEDYHTYYVASGVLVHNRCTNPNGKKGGAAHQGKINEVGETLETNGYAVTYERRVDTTGGYKNVRYGDIYASNGTRSFIVQVGRMTSGGLPVARERRAMLDFLRAGFDVFFVPYN